MIFRSTNIFNIPRELFIEKKRIQSYRILLLYPMKKNELRLNEFFLREYDKSLKQACIELWRACSFSFVSNREINCSWKDKELDKLATFITYGAGELQGSNILKIAFS